MARGARVKLGVLLPSFEVGASHALAVAAEADARGLDGVFAYDHLWPMGSPQRPALAPFPLLAAVASASTRLVVGPLVARVGVVGTAQLVQEFSTLATIAPGRVVAALGTGDRLSAAENEAYGVVTRSAQARRELMAETARALRDSMEVWIGAGSSATNALAREVGAQLNVWNATPDEVRDHARRGPVTWAGPVPSDLHALLDAVAAAGANWAVLSPHVRLDALAEWRRRREVTNFP